MDFPDPPHNPGVFEFLRFARSGDRSWLDAFDRFLTWHERERARMKDPARALIKRVKITDPPFPVWLYNGGYMPDRNAFEIVVVAQPFQGPQITDSMIVAPELLLKNEEFLAGRLVAIVRDLLRQRMHECVTLVPREPAA